MDAGLLVAAGGLIVAEGALVGMLRQTRLIKRTIGEMRGDVHGMLDIIDEMKQGVVELREGLEQTDG